jgi:NitT/TauT family transport system ATP-binding protein
MTMAAAPAAGEIIAVRRLAMHYATGNGKVTALENIDFAVGEGEFVAVVGPSGCGKSTLLKILAGLLTNSAGDALLRGSRITGPRRDIGVVFQSPVLFPWRTVRDNVLLPIDVQRLGRDRHRQIATDLLALVGQSFALWLAIALGFALNNAAFGMDEFTSPVRLCHGLKQLHPSSVQAFEKQ